MIILREIRYECLGLINYLLFPASRRGHEPGPGDPGHKHGGFLPSPFLQNVRGFMERIWEQWKESFAAIESEELGRVNHVILCTPYNGPRIAAARTQASWGQLVGDIFLIYIFVSKFSVCPSQVLVTVRSVSWLSTVPGWGCALSTRNMFDNIQTNTKSTTLRKAERAHHFDSRQKDFF